MMSKLSMMIFMAAGFSLAANISTAGPHARVRLINSAPFNSIVSLTMDTKKIANLVPPGECKKYKKLPEGHYTAHLFDGVLEAVATPLTLMEGYDINVFPLIEAGKPAIATVGIPLADKANKTGGRVVIMPLVEGFSGKDIRIDGELKGIAGYRSPAVIDSLPEGMHTISFEDPILYLTYASQSVYIKGASNNLIVLMGRINPADNSPLTIHAYNDSSKY